MRALCGAIITAGALIGLGITALGIGTRYSTQLLATTEKGDPIIYYLKQLDTPLLLILVFLVAVAIVGLGIAFVGLAYHHHRREREHAWQVQQHAAQKRTTV